MTSNNLHRIILMSATVDAEKISKYFNDCSVFYVPGRTFPVDTRFLEDAVEFTQWSISENSPYAKRRKSAEVIQKLPTNLYLLVNEKYYRGKPKVDWSEETAAGDDDDEETSSETVKLEKRYSPNTAATINLLDERIIPYDLIVRLLERICFEDPGYFTYSSAVLIFMPGIAEIRRMNDLLVEHPAFGGHDFIIYPLHSTISSENQGAVFDIPPAGVRKIVIGMFWYCASARPLTRFVQLLISLRPVSPSPILPA